MNSQIWKDAFGKWLRTCGHPSSGHVMSLGSLTNHQSPSVTLLARKSEGCTTLVVFKIVLFRELGAGWRMEGAALIHTVLYLQTRFLWLKQTWKPRDHMVPQILSSYYFLLYNETNETRNNKRGYWASLMERSTKTHSGMLFITFTEKKHLLFWVLNI